MVLAFGINELDRRGPDILVSAGAIIGCGRRSKRSANGFGLLINSSGSADRGRKQFVLARNVVISKPVSIARLCEKITTGKFAQRRIL